VLICVVRAAVASKPSKPRKVALQGKKMEKELIKKITRYIFTTHTTFETLRLPASQAWLRKVALFKEKKCSDRYLKDVACVIRIALHFSYSYHQHGPR
jgi:hypothetical protein